MSRTHTFVREVRIERPATTVFAWHERPGALQRLMPPWEQAEIVTQEGGLRDGARVVVRARILPLVHAKWEVRHADYQPGRQFVDRQIRGPFAEYEHVHRFLPLGEEACLLRDEIRYRLPGGAAGATANGWVQRRLERLFSYRHALTKADLEQAPASTGTVLLSGASGLLGGALTQYLRTQGWTVLRLVRRRSRSEDEVAWSPEQGTVEWPDRPIDAVIHLAGANLAAARWSEAQKRRIRDSRVHGTRALVAALLRAEPRPRVLISGSATGVYGDAGDAEQTEGSPAGGDFLAEVCQAWEAETAPAAAAGVRTVRLRTGVVLSPAGGALAKLLPPFRAGVGGRLGHGRQWMSWISVDDWLDVVRRALTDARVSGPVNAVAPGAVRNAEFSQTLAHVLGRPAWLPVPAAVLRAALGEMADVALLASTRVAPAALTALHHPFRHPTLESALRYLLGR